MIADKDTQPFSGFANAAEGRLEVRQNGLKCMDLNQIKDFLLALHIVIQAGKGDAACAADVANGSSFVTPICKNLSSVTKDVVELFGRRRRIVIRCVRHRRGSLGRTFVQLSSIENCVERVKAESETKLRIRIAIPFPGKTLHPLTFQARPIHFREQMPELRYTDAFSMNAKAKPQTTDGNFANAGAVPADDEAALVAAAKAGEISAFETLVSRYERKIYRLAQHITQNNEDAEDVSQEAFLKAFEHLGEFQGNSRFYTWLVRIAVNQALMKLRKRRNKDVSLDQEIETEENFIPREIEDWGPSPEERYTQEEMARILSEVIGELDPSFRLVFQLRDIDELSTEETAEALGISVPAVKSRLLRARLKLRDKLNRYFVRGMVK